MSTMELVVVSSLVLSRDESTRPQPGIVYMSTHALSFATPHVRLSLSFSSLLLPSHHPDPTTTCDGYRRAEDHKGSPSVCPSSSSCSSSCSSCSPALSFDAKLIRSTVRNKPTGSTPARLLRQVPTASATMWMYRGASDQDDRDDTGSPLPSKPSTPRM
jgi:hypothetical protein